MWTRRHCVETLSMQASTASYIRKLYLQVPGNSTKIHSGVYDNRVFSRPGNLVYAMTVELKSIVIRTPGHKQGNPRKHHGFREAGRVYKAMGVLPCSCQEGSIMCDNPHPLTAPYPPFMHPLSPLRGQAGRQGRGRGTGEAERGEAGCSYEGGRRGRGL